MRTNLTIASAALLAFAASARASSLVPFDNVEDFGPLGSGSAGTTTDRPAAHLSPITPNNIDDFGPLDVSNPAATTTARPIAHLSPITPNYVDDFGLDAPSTEPGSVGATDDSVQTALNQPSSSE